MLKITIAGPAKSGKTLLAFALDQFLRDHGFSCSIVDRDLGDLPAITGDTVRLEYAKCVTDVTRPPPRLAMEKYLRKLGESSGSVTVATLQLPRDRVGTTAED